MPNLPIREFSLSDCIILKLLNLMLLCTHVSSLQNTFLRFPVWTFEQLSSLVKICCISAILTWVQFMATPPTSADISTSLIIISPLENYVLTCRARKVWIAFSPFENFFVFSLLCVGFYYMKYLNVRKKKNNKSVREQILSHNTNKHVFRKY